jgi:putative endonuclease
MDICFDNYGFGEWAEGEAARFFMLSRGWQLLARRARYREGEIDLIFECEKGLRFVEVKARRGRKFGFVVEALTTRKVRRLKRAVYLWREETQDFRPGEMWFCGMTVGRDEECEFDVLRIEG